ncbi:MAG: glycosyltransferase family 2 protein [Luteolibacter sp.]
MPAPHIIIPVHNRREITLKCLATLKRQGVFDLCQVILINDGCTDGTREETRENFPEVTILDGDGNLFWTGGIKMGMEYAMAQGAPSVIWLNDDCLPADGAIRTLLERAEEFPKAILGAQSYEPDGHTFSYSGGYVRSRQPVRHAKPGEIAECEWLHGNLVLIPRTVIESICYPDTKRFPHYHGDFSYTHRAWKNGIRLLLLGDCMGFCASSATLHSRLLSDEPVISFIKRHFSKRYGCYWPAQLGLELETNGWRGWFRYAKYIVTTLCILALKLTIPSRWKARTREKRALKQSESAATPKI